MIGVAFIVRAYVSEPRLRPVLATTAVYFAVLGATLSPWVAYGMTHFGKPFPSDNTRQVVRAGGNVLDYFEVPPESDLSAHPRKWIADLVLRKARNRLAQRVDILAEREVKSPPGIRDHRRVSQVFWRR